MNDQLIIGDKASFDDFEASLATRNIGMPTKKTIKETVPFSNVTYDFSRINGEQYWEERELEYVFEIIAPTPERLEELKAAFASWVMNIFEEQIHDPFIPDYHFVGTFDDIDFEDEEGLDKTTVTVKFTAYPYKIANLPRVVEFNGIGGGQSAQFYLTNNSSHRVMATFSLEFGDEVMSSKYVTFSIGKTAFTVHDGGSVEILLPEGLVAIGASTTFANSGNYTCKVSFFEEVF